MKDERPRRHYNQPYTAIVDDFREYLIYERNLAHTTVGGYVFFVCEFMEFASKDPGEVKKDDFRDFMKYLRHKQVQNSSLANYIVSLRSFYNWYSDKYKSDKMIEIAFFLQRIMRIRRDKKVPEVPTTKELEKLRETLHAYKTAYSYNKATSFYKMTLRDVAIFEMLIATGARSFELRNVRVCDIDLADNSVFIRDGKGGHQRVAIFSKLAQETLLEHIEHSQLKADTKVFVIRNGNMLNYIIKRWAKRANINSEIHAHSFRHYHVTEAQKNGVPVQVVADQVGHASINTTRHYTHFDVDYRREQYEGVKL